MPASREFSAAPTDFVRSFVRSFLRSFVHPFVERNRAPVGRGTTIVAKRLFVDVTQNSFVRMAGRTRREITARELATRNEFGLGFGFSFAT